MTDKNWLEKLDKIHPYPAKFPVSTAEKYIEKYSKTGDLVFDPFTGSGSGLLAAAANNRYAVGTDINGIAVLISKFKLLNIDESDVKKLNTFLKSVEHKMKSNNYGVLWHYNSINHWFSDESIESLSCIKNEINLFFDDECKLKIFCKLALSAIINTVSKQESDTRYAAIEKKWITHTFVMEKYKSKFNQCLEILQNCQREKKYLDGSKVYLHNSKKCEEILKRDSVDMIITSPPYPNTYDYYLYHKHRMLWLDEDFRYAMNEEIGSRREFSSLKKPKENFGKDLLEIFKSCDKVLKDRSFIVIIIGDGKIQGEMYDSKESTLKVCEKIGWKLIDYSFTDLDKTSRSFQTSFRTNGKKEHILTFQKG